MKPRKPSIKALFKKPATSCPSRALVAPGAEAKSGCHWCSLLPWSSDFSRYESGFQRNADAIKRREPDGHLVKARCVSQEWSKVDVLFIGEAPNGDEDNRAEPFVGRVGSLLKSALQETVTGFDVGMAHIVRCRPPRNRDPNKTEVQSCSPELLREIAAREPKLLVALGNKSLKFLTGQTGITTLQGQVLECQLPGFEHLPVLGCLHPAYILRFDHELPKFIDALTVAQTILDGTYDPPEGPGEYFVLTDLDDIEALFDSFRADAEIASVYWDTETGSLYWWEDKFPQLLCWSFTNEAGYGFTIPYDHVESPFREEGPERERLKALLIELFTDESIDFCAQNGKFDKKQARARLGVDPVRVRDTMLTHHAAIDESRGTHGLKTLAYGHSGMGGYERPLEKYIAEHPEANPDRGGSYANIPGDLLFEYAAMDPDATARVDISMRSTDEYARPKARVLADVFLPFLSDTLADVEWAGAKIDSDTVEWLDHKYLGEMDAKKYQIKALGKVAMFEAGEYFAGKTDSTFNPGSSKQLQTILFDPDHYGETPTKLTDGGFDRLQRRFKKAEAKWREEKKGPQPQFIDVVKDAIKRREWQHFSTDAQVLQTLDQRGNELAKLILEYREASTLHGTFVIPLMYRLDPDGFIHGEFLLHGTVTSRLASRNPNLQNIPNKGGGLIKRAYVSRFGEDGVILQADYSQVELRVAASLFQEWTMIDAYVNGEDLHMLTVLALSGFTQEEHDALDEDTQKNWRSRAKRVNFGVLYGGGPPALVNTLKKDGINISVDDARDLIDRYFRARPALKRGMDALMKDVQRHGFLETFTGRRRRVPEVNSVDEQQVARALRQSVNFPVQSTASDMTLMALVLINRELKKRELKSCIILTVHDSIVFDCHVDEFDEVSKLAKEIMESLPSRSEEVMPGLDWSWLLTPIVADFEVGMSWGTLVKFDPTDYDVDEVWDQMLEKAAA